MPKVPNSDYIYFMQNPSNGLIKIGESNLPTSRRRSLEARLGEDLKILGVLPQFIPMESSLHFKFQHLHDHGEWFRAGEDLMQFIENSNVLLKQGIPALLNNQTHIIEQQQEIINKLLEVSDEVLAQNKKLRQAIFVKPILWAYVLACTLFGILLVIQVNFF